MNDERVPMCPNCGSLFCTPLEPHPNATNTLLSKKFMCLNCSCRWAEAILSKEEE